MRNRHDKTTSLILSGGTIFGVVWLIGVLLSFALLCGGAYVAWHFIQKFW